MRFKRNPTVTVACVVTECLLSLIPAIFMIYFFFVPDQIHDLFSALLIIPHFIIIVNGILVVISLVSCIFMKTKFFLVETGLIVHEKDKISEIKYDQVAMITYDCGKIFAQFNRTPSQLVLHSKNCKQLLAVKNPSIVMVHFLRKRCKNATVHLEHNKRIWFFLTLINGIILLSGVLFTIFR